MSANPYEDREQTEVKHRILERYLEAFAPIVGSWAADIAYVDCLAGPWRSASPNLTDTSFARAIGTLRQARLALRLRGKTPSFRCLLIELDVVAFRRLEEYGAAVEDVEVTTKNWDFAAHIPEIVAFAKERRNSFPFIFIDPTGWELATIDLIRPLLQLNPGEVLINLMTSWITRFLSDPSKGFDRLFGQEEVERIRSLPAEQQEEELVRTYAGAVRRAGGFKYVCNLPVMKPDQDAFHFHMVYGTRHAKGVEVFKSMEQTVIPFMHRTRAAAQARRRLERTSQPGLFGAEATYREQKFSLLRQNNLAAAKSAVAAMLERQADTLYDDIWAESMQYAAVMEEDVRNWIDEWDKQGKIKIENMQAGRRVVQRGKNITLHRLS